MKKEIEKRMTVAKDRSFIVLTHRPSPKWLKAIDEGVVFNYGSFWVVSRLTNAKESYRTGPEINRVSNRSVGDLRAKVNPKYHWKGGVELKIIKYGELSDIPECKGHCDQHLTCLLDPNTTCQKTMLDVFPEHCFPERGIFVKEVVDELQKHYRNIPIGHVVQSYQKHDFDNVDFNLEKELVERFKLNPIKKLWKKEHCDHCVLKAIPGYQGKCSNHHRCGPEAKKTLLQVKTIEELNGIIDAKITEQGFETLNQMYSQMGNRKGIYKAKKEWPYNILTLYGEKNKMISMKIQEDRPWIQCPVNFDWKKNIPEKLTDDRRNQLRLLWLILRAMKGQKIPNRLWMEHMSRGLGCGVGYLCYFRFGKQNMTIYTSQKTKYFQYPSTLNNIIDLMKYNYFSRWEVTQMIQEHFGVKED